VHKVLYRRWRPKNFLEVSGQDHVTKVLQNQVKSGRISHAYLFTGSRGTGKTSCAKILAKAVNCLDLKNGNPCGVCESCKSIELERIIDVIEIDAASNNGVDNMRNLCENANFVPVSVKYKVYIIDEVHMLSAGAFNALLKTLEEPPDYVIFILATTELHKLPATVVSRCQRFEFKKINTGVIQERLNFIALQENIDLNSDASLILARLADGALRDAVSLLDKCSSVYKKIDINNVQEITGIINKNYLFKLANFIINSEISEILKIIDKVYMSSKDLARFCVDLIEYFRNIIFIKTVENFQEILFLTQEENREFQMLCSRISLRKAVYIIDILQKCLKNMCICVNINKKTELEINLIKLCEIKEDFKKEIIVKEEKQEELEEKEKSFDEDIKIEKRNEKSKKKLNIWFEVLEELKKESSFWSDMLSDAKFYIEENNIFVETWKRSAEVVLKDEKLRQKIINIVEKITGKIYSFGEKKGIENKNLIDNFIYKAKNVGIDVEIYN